jgi:hypothetical protein
MLEQSVVELLKLRVRQGASQVDILNLRADIRA